MNQTKILTILIGALLGAVPIRGQDNVEAIVAQNVRPLLPQNGRGGGVAVAVRMNATVSFSITGLPICRGTNELPLIRFSISGQ